MSEHEEYEVEALAIEVSAQPIELYKVLKIANLVSGGGEAKFAIAEGYVGVNGELEQRKRRKLYDGDVIEFNQEYYVVICDQPVTEPAEAKPKKEKKSESLKASSQQSESKKANVKKASAQKASGKKPTKPAKKKAAKAEQKPTRDQNTGRRSISF